MCKLAQFLVRNRVTNSTSLVNLRGNIIVGAEELDVVDDIRGNLIIVGVGTSSSRHINGINNVRGNAIICGMSVGSLTETRGNTIIFNGEVGNINDHRGNLVLIHSPHSGTATNIHGNFIQL